MRWTACLLAVFLAMPLWPGPGWAVTPSQGVSLPAGPSSLEQRELARFLQAQNIRTITQYIQWFENHMSYQADGKQDAWARPLDTLVRQKGDCEDLAFLNKAMLQLFGIEGRVLGTRKDNNHHVFLVFEHNNRIYIFDNTRCILTKARSVEDIASFLYRKYDIDYLLEVQNTPRHIRVLYDKFALRGYAQLTSPLPAS